MWRAGSRSFPALLGLSAEDGNKMKADKPNVCKTLNQSARQDRQTIEGGQPVRYVSRG